MRRTLGILSLFALAGLAGAVAFSRQQQAPPPPPPPAGQALDQSTGQQPTVRQRVAEVDMLLSVVNRKQKFIVDLEQKDFKLLEDNHEQEIKFFSRQIDLPLRLGLLMDTSNSIRPRLQFEKRSGNELRFQYIAERSRSDVRHDI